MIFHSLTSVHDEVAKVPKDWWLREYAPISCPSCWSVLPDFREQPVDVVIVPGISWRGPSVALPYYIGLQMIRRDFLEALSGHLAGFWIGRIREGPVPRPDYVSVLASSGVRVAMAGDSRSQVSSCPECGRRCEANTGLNAIVQAGPLPRVCTPMGGRPFLISDDVYNALPAQLRDELGATAVPVGVHKK